MPVPLSVNRAFHSASVGKFAGVDDDVSARRVFDRVGNQILDDAFQQTGVRVCDQLIRDAVDEARTGGSGYWIQIVNQSFHERP